MSSLTVLYEFNSKEFLWHFLASYNLCFVLDMAGKKKEKNEIKTRQLRILTKERRIELHQAVSQVKRGCFYNDFAMMVNKI